MAEKFMNKAQAKALAEKVKTYVDNGLNAKQNTLTAGDNITITNGVISSSGGGAGSDKLYVHRIFIRFSADYFGNYLVLRIINKVQTAYTYSTFLSNYSGRLNYYDLASGSYNGASITAIANQGSTLKILYTGENSSVKTALFSSIDSFEDKVEEVN